MMQQYEFKLKRAPIRFFLIVLAIAVFQGEVAAYPVVFNANRLTKFSMLYLLAGFMIPFQTTLIPLFQLMSDLRLIDKIYGLVILYMSGLIGRCS